jgi:uncharacterized protein HemX
VLNHSRKTAKSITAKVKTAKSNSKGRIAMANEKSSSSAKGFTLGLDTWAVLLALALALAVRFNLLTKVPW